MEQGKIEEMKAKHGAVYELRAGEELALTVRAPLKGDLSRFWREREKDGIAAASNLLCGCLLEPSWAELKPLLEARPGVILPLAGELLEMAGATETVISKKL